MPGNKEEEDAGEELRQADQTQVQWAFGNFVDLPADRNGLHFGGYDDAEAGELIIDERGIAERRAGIQFCFDCFGSSVVHRADARLCWVS